MAFVFALAFGVPAKAECPPAGPDRPPSCPPSCPPSDCIDLFGGNITLERTCGGLVCTYIQGCWCAYQNDYRCNITNSVIYSRYGLRHSDEGMMHGIFAYNNCLYHGDPLNETHDFVCWGDTGICRWCSKTDNINICDDKIMLRRELLGLAGSWQGQECQYMNEFRCKESGKIVRTAVGVRAEDEETMNCPALVLKCETCEIKSVELSPEDVAPKGTGGETQATLKITLQKPAPEEGCEVELKVEADGGPAGHGHSNGRPEDKKGRLSQNVLWFLAGEKGPKGLMYSSSEVSGMEKIGYRLKRNITVSQSGDTTGVSGDGEDWKYKDMKVWVKGLKGLIAANFILTGSYGEQGVTSMHTQNHFGTENTNDALVEIVGVYYEQYTGFLRINDISLPWGGLFDIGNNWSSTPGHENHRVGKNVDMDDVTAEGKAVTLENLKNVIWKKLEKYEVSIKDHGNHFHLTFP